MSNRKQADRYGAYHDAETDEIDQMAAYWEREIHEANDCGGPEHCELCVQDLKEARAEEAKAKKNRRVA